MPTTVQGPAWITVTGTWLPSSPNTCVMPTLRPIRPSFFAMTLGRGLSPPSDASPRDSIGEGRDGPLRSLPPSIAAAKPLLEHVQSSELDLHVDARRQGQLHQGGDGLGG